MNNIADKYTQLESILALASVDAPVSEVHGIIIGAVSNHLKSGTAPDLLRLVTPNAEKADYQPLNESLHDLYREYGDLLFSGEDGFDLLLPGDDESLNFRIDSLASWCRGYLLGLLHDNAFSVDQLPENGPEIVRDIMQISEADASLENEPEKEDWALSELHEYIKVGVQLVFESIYSERADQAPDMTH